MLKTRGRKIIRDVMARKGRTALVALSILIGVFGAVTLISANDLVVSQLEEDIKADEIAMLQLSVTVPQADADVGLDVQDDGAVTDEMLRLVRAEMAKSAQDEVLPGVAGATAIEANAVVPTFWRKTGDTDAPFEDGDVMTFSEPMDQIDLEPMRKVAGEWPQPGQYQLAIEKRMADEHGLAVGDTIVFRSLGQDDPQEWEITATVFHPYWVETDGFNMPEQRIYAWFEDAQQITGISSFTKFYLRYIDTEAAEAQAPLLEQTIRRETTYIPEASWLESPDDYTLIRNVQEITGILNILAVLALVVSGFLVTNVVNTIVVEQKSQVGVLKSIGATWLDNFAIYAGVALVYGILGTIPGLILGAIAGSQMAQAVAPLASTLIESFQVSALGMAVGAVMGLLVPIVAAFVPVLNGTRVSILDAMTDLGISAEWGGGPVARLLKAIPLPPNIQQALSNVAQKKGRLALTVITLTLAAAAFMGVFATFTVLTDEINKIYDTFNYEAVVVPNPPQPPERVERLIMGDDDAGLPAVEGVEDIYPGVMFSIKLVDLSGTVIAVGQDTDLLQGIGYAVDKPVFDFTFKAGHGFDEDDPSVDPNLPRVLLSSVAADGANKSVNDRINITAGGDTRTFKIIGVVYYPFELAFMQWQDLARLSGFVDDQGNPLPTTFFTNLDADHDSPDGVDMFIDTVSGRMLDNNINAVYSNQVQEQEAQTENIMVFNMIFQITSGVMAAVGAIGLLTTLSMAVFERQKEIGVMRSIGAGSGTIISQFQVEGMIIGLIAWVLAVPLSYGIALLLMDGLQFGDLIDFSYPLWVLGLGLVGMIVIAFIASLWPAVAASRKTVSNILRYQ
jgi:ABC-type antimicrobial peptide transport system permease subunit